MSAFGGRGARLLADPGLDFLVAVVRVSLCATSFLKADN